MERILTRVALRSARPRDLSRLLSSLAALPTLRAELSHCDTPLLRELSTVAREYPDLVELLHFLAKFGNVGNVMKLGTHNYRCL